MKFNSVYIAASFPRKAEAFELAQELSLLGIKVTSRWLFAESKGYRAAPETAVMDEQDVLRAEAFVSLIGDLKTLGGRHTELGIAIGAGKQCFLIGISAEQVFHHHPNVTVGSRVEIIRILTGEVL